MVLALSPGSDVMSILDKLGENLGKSLVNLNLNVCLMQFEAEMSDSPVFMCCAKADGLQACVQSKFLEPCQWYIPGLALKTVLTARLNIYSIWQRQGQYPSFMGENG